MQRLSSTSMFSFSSFWQLFESIIYSLFFFFNPSSNFFIFKHAISILSVFSPSSTVLSRRKLLLLKFCLLLLSIMLFESKSGKIGLITNNDFMFGERSLSGFERFILKLLFTLLLLVFVLWQETTLFFTKKTVVDCFFYLLT